LWIPGKLAQGTFTVGIGMVLRSLIQALVFLIVARTLGAEGFGSFAAVAAIASALSFFSGLGANVMLVRNIARDRSNFPESFGYALTAFSLGIPITGLLYFVIASLALPDSISWLVIILLGISEIVFSPLTGCGYYAYQGFEMMSKVSLMQLIPAITRLVGAFALLISHRLLDFNQLLLLWSWLYLFCSLAAATYVNCMVIKDLGKPIFPKINNLLSYIWYSIPFSFSGVAEKLYADGDKFMLARLSSVNSAGLYSAGYRFVDLAYIPLQALMSAASPGYFRKGSTGVAGSMSYSFKIYPLPLFYGVTVGCLIFLCAPMLPLLIGASFTEAIDVARWLAWLPLVTVPRMLLHYPLATSGLQKDAMLALVVGACCNLFLNFLWIPLWNWRGAVAATYLTEILMIVTMLYKIISNWHSKPKLSNMNKKFE
jgi:O-antigen/teichoic acid export membrane protein